jgi:chromosome segregation ATPase
MESALEAQRGNAARMRELHDSMLKEHQEGSARLEGYETRWQSLNQRLGESEIRASGMEQLLADLTPVTESVADSKRQLALVKAVTDQLSKKASVLEQQRDQVDRTANRLEQLSGLAQRVEASLQQQAAQTQNLAETGAALEGLARAQQGIADRTRGLTAECQTLDDGVSDLKRELSAMRETTERTTQRFELDRGSFEGLSQRLADLRRGVSDAEARLASMAESGRMIDQLSAKVEALAGETATATASLAEASELSARVKSSAADLERLDDLSGTLEKRLDRLEQARPAMDAAMQDLANLRRSHEGVREALDQVRSTEAELGTIRAALTTTEGWLGETQQRIATLRQDVTSLDRVRGTVDDLQREIGQVSKALEVIEERRETVDAIQRRLSEIGAQGNSIEDRTGALTKRLDAAEERSGALLPRLEEAGRVGSRLHDLAAQLRDTEQRVQGVRNSVSEVETRAGNLEALEERVRVLARETDLRQVALEQAAVQLKEASTLRQEAAETVQALDERSRQVNQSLERVSEQLGKVEELWSTLDGRIANLRSVEERLSGFERRLREWKGTEEQLGQALEQATAKQSTLTTLQAEIRNVYQLAERAMRDAGAVAEAQPRIQQARHELDGVLKRLREVDAATASFEERRRQVIQAEERLAYAEAVLMDLQGSMETLVAQKADVDHLLEKTTALSLQSKQAEALIDVLRDERRVNERIRSALSELRGGRGNGEESRSPQPQP